MMLIIKEYVFTIIQACLIAAFLIIFIVQSFIVEGSSMEPTLHSGERILVEKISYRFKRPARQDIIVLKSPSKKPFIKRIIGIEGDTLFIRDGKLYLNQELLEEPYIKEQTNGDWGPYIVPHETVFVLGDNRNNSNDSRFSVGYLNFKDIKGKAIFCFYPFNKMRILK